VKPTVFYLFGFPGTGKYTVAKSMERLVRADGGRLVVVDNHYMNNPIFGVLDIDGVTPLDPIVWERTGEIVEAVLRTIETLSPASWSFVFTNYLQHGAEPDHRLFDRVAKVAVVRGNAFLPVRLTCEVEELARRVVSPERRERLKYVDAEGVRHLATTAEVLSPQVPHLALDITHLSPDQAAARILDHAQGLEG
jgi:hypothetical protein